MSLFASVIMLLMAIVLVSTRYELYLIRKELRRRRVILPSKPYTNLDRCCTEAAIQISSPGVSHCLKCGADFVWHRGIWKRVDFSKGLPEEITQR